jgi:hypothetical protein
VLSLDLPDPGQDDISTMEFLARLEEAWAVCDRFDLQTEIWRGRILRAVRDREKRGGEGRGTGFLQWLREREISKTRAYTLIQLADSADSLVGEGLLEPDSVNQFSKRAFLETAQAEPEVQQMISEAANGGLPITRKQVRRLSDDFLAATSPLLPEEIRQRTAENLLPSRAVAPLVKELARLPEEQQDDLRRVLRDEPELDNLKESGAIEEDADTVILLHPMGNEGDGSLLILAKIPKNRQGRRGRLALSFHGKTQRWAQSRGMYRAGAPARLTPEGDHHARDTRSAVLRRGQAVGPAPAPG